MFAPLFMYIIYKVRKINNIKSNYCTNMHYDSVLNENLNKKLKSFMILVYIIAEAHL